MTHRTKILLFSALAALLTGAALAGSATATPAWHFGGVELEGEEGTSGTAANSRVTVPGLTTDCDGTLTMTVFNKAKVGAGEVTELPLTNCGTNAPECTVEAAEAVGLPWSATIKTVSTVPYVVLEEVQVEVLYGGEECALNEFVVLYKGTVGGRFDNVNGTVNFEAAKLSALGTSVQWSAVFPLLANGARKGEALTIE